MRGLEDFREVVVVDFEFRQPDGERPEPVCVVAHELVSGRLHRRMLDTVVPAEPPYPVGDDVLVVAYYAPAELGCHLSLGWTLPVHVLDLYAEFRNLTNGLEVPAGRSLLGALTYHNLDSIEAVKKDDMRQLAQRGAPYTEQERRAPIEYTRRASRAREPLVRPSLSLSRLVRDIGIRKLIRQGFGRRIIEKISHRALVKAPTYRDYERRIEEYARRRHRSKRSVQREFLGKELQRRRT